MFFLKKKIKDEILWYIDMRLCNMVRARLLLTPNELNVLEVRYTGSGYCIASNSFDFFFANKLEMYKCYSNIRQTYVFDVIYLLRYLRLGVL